MSESYKDRETNTTSPGNLDYDFNTEYGDGDIPEIDLPSPANVTKEIPYEFPGKTKK